jgi:capsular exopolysaccharide synthesis family protein
MDGAETLAQFPQLVTTRAVLEDARGNLGFSRSVAQLRDGISASPVGDTPLLRIKVKDSEASRSVAIADAVAQSLVDHVSAAQQARWDAVQEQLSPGLDDLAPENLAWAQGSREALTATLASLARRPYILAPAEVLEDSAAESSPTAAGVPVVRNLVLGLFLGGIIATAAVIALELIQSPLRSPQQLERRNRLNSLGVVPCWQQPGSQPQRLAVSGASGPAAVEALREVAASVAFTSKVQGARVLAVVSPDGGDGRSSLAANLGVALASPWRKVVLVDADLRQPGLHHYFGLGNSLGLRDFLLNTELQATDIVQETPYPGLKVITSGPVAPGGPSLLDSPGMGYLWERLEEMADLVLVDTPPLKGTVDGVVIASQVQAVVLLVNGDTARQGALGEVLAKLAMAKAPVLGYVWNRMSPGRAGRYSGSRRHSTDLSGLSSPFQASEDGTEAASAAAPVNGRGAGRPPGHRIKASSQPSL